MEEFVFRSRIEASARDVFQWHAMPGAFERLNPPWEPVQILDRRGGIRDGDRTILEMHMGPIRTKWIAEHRNYVEELQFQDVQISGPFAHWEHTHLFEPDGENACFLEDRIMYKLPMGALGKALGAAYTQNKLRRMFLYRHRQTRQDLETLSRYPRESSTILISGSTGLLGTALIPFLQTAGHSIKRLIRNSSPRFPDSIVWNPSAGIENEKELEECDTVIHLAGENISGRWNKEKKRKIYESRVQGTRMICDTLARLDQPPQTFICASAIGYYGDRKDEILFEHTKPGNDFLAQVCQDWENASQPAVERGIRVVHMRIGVVLTPLGGALKQMLFPFQLGLGGVIGSGEQYVSWISVDDLISAIYHVMKRKDIHGVVNAVAPNPVTNRSLTKILGKTVNRPTLFPLPAIAVEPIFGEMGKALLLSSARVQPERLLDTNFTFRHPDLETALRHMLGKDKKRNHEQKRQ